MDPLELEADEEAGVAMAADGWRRIREGVGSVVTGELIGGDAADQAGVFDSTIAVVEDVEEFATEIE